MVTQTELELKLKLCERDAAALAAHRIFAAPDARRRQISSVYFDDLQRRVRDAGYSLRVRHVGERRVQTIKSLTAGVGLFDRLEWACEVAQPSPTVASLGATPLAQVYPDAGRLRDLRPIFVVNVDRTSRTVDLQGNCVEVVLDVGEVRCENGGTAKICELELELKSGSRDAMFKLAHDLQRQAPVWPLSRSKADVGYRLVDGAPPRRPDGNAAAVFLEALDAYRCEPQHQKAALLSAALLRLAFVNRNAPATSCRAAIASRARDLFGGMKEHLRGPLIHELDVFALDIVEMVA